MPTKPGISELLNEAIHFKNITRFLKTILLSLVTEISLHLMVTVQKFFYIINVQKTLVALVNVTFGSISK